MTPPRAVLVPDHFLSEVLGRSASRMEPGSDVRAVVASASGFVHAKVDTRDLATTAELAAAGFRLVATEVQFAAEAAVVRATGTVERGTVRDAVDGDLAEVDRIAGSSFVEDRFHRDAAIEPELADLVKREWARNFFRGTRGDRMLVVESDATTAVGFVQVLSAGIDRVIDLIAVARAHRGRGLGYALVRAVADLAHEDGAKVRVGTQLTNLASINLYVGLGLRPVASSYVWHLHRPEGR